MSELKNAEIIWFNSEDCAVAKGTIDGRGRHVLLAEDGSVAVSDTIVGAANLACGCTDDGIAEFIRIGREGQSADALVQTPADSARTSARSADAGLKETRHLLIDGEVYLVDVMGGVHRLHVDFEDLEEFVEFIVVDTDAQCSELIKDDPEQVERNIVSEVTDWISHWGDSEGGVTLVWSSSCAHSFFGLDRNDACAAECAALARGVHLRAAALEEQGVEVNLEEVLRGLAHDAVCQERARYESEVLSRLQAALSGRLQDPSPATGTADDIPLDDRESEDGSESASIAKGADMQETAERLSDEELKAIYETQHTVLVEDIDEGAYFTPIPSKLAEPVAEAFERAGLLYHIEFLPRRDAGYPYSLWEASEILCEELPELYPDGPAGVRCCVLASRVSPAATFALVEELEKNPCLYEKSSLDERYEESAVLDEGKAAILRTLMERSWAGEPVFEMEDDADGQRQ